MRFEQTSDGFHTLLVEDDGAHSVRHEGNGLRGMRERVQALGGRFNIQSDHGTRLLIELPITAPTAVAREA
jgi:two-component system sensor histidine kinase DesK